MSKSIVRIIVAVLISLGVIAAAPSVQARLGSILQKADSKNVVYVSVNNKALEKGGLSPSIFDDGMGSGHDCGSDPTSDY